jgi:hypothetical protein
VGDSSQNLWLVYLGSKIDSIKEKHPEISNCVIDVVFVSNLLMGNRNNASQGFETRRWSNNHCIRGTESYDGSVSHHTDN